MKILFHLIVLMITNYTVHTRILEVGQGKQFSIFQPALSVAVAGDTILLREGVYSGNSYRENLKGTSENWVTILAAPNENVVFRGGGAAFYLVDVEYIRINGLQFEDQTGNSLSIDDGGTYDTPTHNVVILNCTWLSMNTTGPSNMIKMAGVDSFSIYNCVFLNGPVNGIGIDLVGCHFGVIDDNYFDKSGSYAIQAKGGSNDIDINRNLFINSTDRTINIGGSTGTPYFRPLNADYEAKRVNVYSNVFRGSKAPITFATAIDCEVINNTILNPVTWAFRILQETSDTRFITCSNNTIKNNLIVMPTTGQPALNIGPNTDASSFSISHNAWFNPKNAQWMPNTPSNEPGRLLIDPEIIDSNGIPSFENIVNSSGINVIKPSHGFNNVSFDGSSRSIGAYSQKIHTSVIDKSEWKSIISISPNPVNDEVRFSGLLAEEQYSILNVRMQKVWEGIVSNSSVISVANFPAGIYYIVSKNNSVVTRFVKIQ